MHANRTYSGVLERSLVRMLTHVSTLVKREQEERAPKRLALEDFVTCYLIQIHDTGAACVVQSGVHGPSTVDLSSTTFSIWAPYCKNMSEKWYTADNLSLVDNTVHPDWLTASHKSTAISSVSPLFILDQGHPVSIEHEKVLAGLIKLHFKDLAQIMF